MRMIGNEPTCETNHLIILAGSSTSVVVHVTSEKPVVHIPTVVLLTTLLVLPYHPYHPYLVIRYRVRTYITYMELSKVHHSPLHQRVFLFSFFFFLFITITIIDIIMLIQRIK